MTSGDGLMGSEIEDAVFVQALDVTWVGYPEIFGVTYFKELVKGGVTAIHESLVWPVQTDFNGIIKAAYRLRRTCVANGVLVARTASDIERAKREGKLAVIFGLQHIPFAMESHDDLGYIDMLHKLDVRIAQLTYMMRSHLGDGCGERTDSGLSSFGIAVVAEMNRLGMLLDLSHLGLKSSMEAIELSKDPMIYSHVNCRSINPTCIRNASDEQIKAVAEKDGVIGISSCLPLLNMERPPTLKDYLDHITHVIDLVGVNYVGVGLDYPMRPPMHPDYHKYYLAKWDKSDRDPAFAGVPGMTPRWNTFIPGKGPYVVEGLDSALKLKASISKGLAERGYSSSEIVKVLGSNFMRVFKKVWRT